MSTVPAKLTIIGRQRQVNNFRNICSYFKVGEGGFTVTGTGKIPKSPDDSLLDLDCIINSAYYAGVLGHPPKVCQKSLVPATDFLFTPVAMVGTLAIRCFLDIAEGNWAPPDPLPIFIPEYFEIGIFGIFGGVHEMIYYGTFPGETKTNAKTLLHTAKLIG